MSAPLTLTQDGNLARIHLDDGRGNALSNPMLTALLQATTAAASADAVLLTGRDRVFCGGLDLAQVVPMKGDEMRAFLETFHQAMRAVFALPRPVVVAVAGSAVAGGAILLCAADLRISARDSGVVGVNEARLGIPFPVSALEIVRNALPGSEAARALLFGELSGKEEALRRGYFHQLIEPDQLLREAERLVRDAASLPSSATSEIKRELRAEALRRIDDNRARSHEAFATAWTHPAAQQRLNLVLEGLRTRK